MGALAASRTSAESIRLTAPSSAGTWYYGACVASVSDESDTRNNCSAGVRVTVEASSPDLIVESVSVSESSLTTGVSFTLRATVRNQGTGRSAATTLRYYRSTNATITTRDTQVGTDAVGALAASGTSAQSSSLTAPSNEGTYYYGACVAGVSGESDTRNNCSRGVKVTVARASSGFAPADQDAFNSRMVGKSLRTDTWHLDFVSAGRFSENGRLPGSYSYSNTGSNTGLLEQTYDGGEYGGACAIRLTFASETSGTYSYTCDSGAEGQGAWQVAEIGVPSAPTVAPGSGTVLEISFKWILSASATEAFDFQVRTKSPRGEWLDWCATFRNPSAQGGRYTLTTRILDAEPSTVYEVRYRHRNSSRCGGGTPGRWSEIGEGATSGGGTSPAWGACAPLDWS